MIKTLRVRFIALTMGLLLALLAAIVLVFNVLSYRSVAASSDKLLSLLSAHGGRFPGGDEFNYESFDRSFSREVPSESRFFFVRVTESGRALMTDTSRVTRIGSEQAVAYAARALRAGRERGFLGDYRYLVCEEDGGERTVFFLDCMRSLGDFRSFLYTSVLITLSGYALVFALVVLFSGRIVQPFSDNYERQKQFITNAGHELKTPLSIIAADADVLELETGESEWLQDIRRQTDRLAGLTNDLICLSRMQELELQMRKTPFCLTDAVQEAAQSFQAPALAQGRTLTLDLAPQITLCGDEKAVRQLVSILLDNALKHADAGSDVALSLRRKGRSALLSVENAASAVSPEDLPHLFDRFYRADKSRSAQTGGYGIGLSIARAVAEAHRGTIQAVLSAPGRLRITAALPL